MSGAVFEGGRRAGGRQGEGRSGRRRVESPQEEGGTGCNVPPTVCVWLGDQHRALPSPSATQQANTGVAPLHRVTKLGQSASTS